MNQKGIAPLLLLLLAGIGILIGLYLVGNPQIFSPHANNSILIDNYIPFRKLYNSDNNGWIWSPPGNELNEVTAQGYSDQGILFYAFPSTDPAPGSVPLYRLRRPADPFTQSFMTTNINEYKFVLTSGHPELMDSNDGNDAFTTEWQTLDLLYYVYPPVNAPAGSVPVYRLMYNSPGHPYHGIRYYSADSAEVKALLKTGQYFDEGIVFYGFNPNLITADPNPCVLNPSGLCTSKITWNVPNAFDLRITIKENPGSLFATGPSGSQDAPWISAQGATFEAWSGGQKVGSVFVKGNPQ